MRVWIGVVLLFALPIGAWAGADCKEPQALSEDIGCASEALHKADKKLNEVYKTLSANLDKEGKTKLRDAQRAWIQFRDADTALAYYNSGEGGSLGGLIAINHKLVLTLERIKQLEEFSNTRGR